MQSVTVLAVLLCAACAALSVSTASASPAPLPFRGKVGSGTGGNPLNRPDNGRHGSAQGAVHRDKGVGTSVHVRGNGDVWRSQDGTARVHAQGSYGQVVHGPAKGARGGSGMINFEKKF